MATEFGEQSFPPTGRGPSTTGAHLSAASLSHSELERPPPLRLKSTSPPPNNLYYWSTETIVVEPQSAHSANSSSPPSDCPSSPVARSPRHEEPPTPIQPLVARGRTMSELQQANG